MTVPNSHEEVFKNAVSVEAGSTRQITLGLTGSVLDAFKATGKAYHSRLNVVLEDDAKRVLETGA